MFKYLRNQVRTFNRKYARITSFNKIIGNKLNKSGLFEETAAYLLLALGRFEDRLTCGLTCLSLPGGNISAASCGETTRNKSSAVETYTVLSNCSTSVSHIRELQIELNEEFLILDQRSLHSA